MALMAKNFVVCSLDPMSAGTFMDYCIDQIATITRPSRHTNRPSGSMPIIFKFCAISACCRFR